MVSDIFSKVVCNKMLLLLLVGLSSAIALNGCGNFVTPKFEDTNQVLLENTVKKIELENAVADVIPAGSKITLVSLETENSDDNPVTVMIEDQLIHSLINSDHIVLERDDDVIRKLIEEQDSSYLCKVYLPIDIKTVSAGIGGSYGKAGYLKSEVVTGGVGYSHTKGIGRDTVIVFDTHLDAADYIISYRVLECGIVYRRIGMYGDMRKREAMVRLHLRVQDTRSGAILYADNIKGILEDEVESKMMDDLEKYHYPFYSNDLPVTKGPKATRYEVQDDKKEGSKSSGNYSFVGAGILSLMALAAFLVSL